MATRRSIRAADNHATTLREALRKHAIPSLRASGFEGSFPLFRRITASRTHVMWFSVDRGANGGVELELASVARRTDTSVREDYHRSINIRNRRRVLLSTLVPPADAARFWYEDAQRAWGRDWAKQLALRLAELVPRHAERWWKRR